MTQLHVKRTIALAQQRPSLLDFLQHTEFWKARGLLQANSIDVQATYEVNSRELLFVDAYHLSGPYKDTLLPASEVFSDGSSCGSNFREEPKLSFSS